MHLISGIEGASLTEPGHFLSSWQPDKSYFAFSPQPFLCFTEEESAKLVCDTLHDEMEIEAKVIRYPVHQVA